MEIKSKLFFVFLSLMINNIYAGMCSAGDDTCMATVFTFFMPTLVTIAPTMTSRDSAEDKDNLSKPMIDAKPDASAYIAADGKDYHTARLENAFAILRKKYPRLSDMELAKIIIQY